MQQFTDTMHTVINWLLGMLSDLVGFFLKYPFMAFAMLAGVVYLVIDSVLLAFSGHAVGGGVAQKFNKKISIQKQERQQKKGIRNNINNGGVHFATDSHYSQLSGGKAFFSQKKKKRSNKGNTEKRKKQDKENDN